MGNFAENMAVIKNGQQLCIEKRKLLSSNDTIFFYISRMRQKRYQLQLIMDAATTRTGNAVFLEDIFLRQQTAISFVDTVSYSFSVTTDSASYNNSRFSLVTKAVNQFVQLKVQLQQDDVQLQWSITDTAGKLSFYIERSQDNTSFETIGSTQAFAKLSLEGTAPPGLTVSTAIAEVALPRALVTTTS